MMLPGKAMVKVYERPVVGWKTAVGFDVSTEADVAAAWWRTTLRFLF
jgi:hypothetical protein